MLRCVQQYSEDDDGLGGRRERLGYGQATRFGEEDEGDDGGAKGVYSLSRYYEVLLTPFVDPYFLLQ